MSGSKRANQNDFLLCKDFEQLNRRIRNLGTRTEDSRCAILVELVVILCRNYATHSYDDILTTKFSEFLDNLRNESEVSCCGTRVRCPAASEDTPTT